MAKKASSKTTPVRSDKDTVYRLEVSLVSGLVSKAFVEKNPQVQRTIEIRGDQTLEDLHFAIFDAYDREDEHLYEFTIFGPSKRQVRRFLQDFGESYVPEDVEGFVESFTLHSLGLKVKTGILYQFDFGDSWKHDITVVDIGDRQPRSRYPRITNRVGASPPQYPSLDEWD